MVNFQGRSTSADLAHTQLQNVIVAALLAHTLKLAWSLDVEGGDCTSHVVLPDLRGFQISLVWPRSALQPPIPSESGVACPRAGKVGNFCCQLLSLDGPRQISRDLSISLGSTPQVHTMLASRSQTLSSSWHPSTPLRSAAGPIACSPHWCSPSTRCSYPGIPAIRSAVHGRDQVGLGSWQCKQTRAAALPCWPAA